MNDREHVRQLILAVLDEITDLDVAALDPHADLFDIGIDSLEFTTVIVEVEERLGDQIPAEAFDRFAELEQFTLISVLDALVGPERSPGVRMRP